MANMDSVKVGGPTLILMKGEPGLGKSIAAASYPKPMYIFDFEDKMDAVKNYYTNIVKKPEVLKDIEFDTYRNWDTAWLKLTQFGISCKYKTIVFDSLTASAWLAIMSLVRLKGESGGKKVGNIKVAGIEDYGGEAAALNNMLDQFISLRQMGVTVILTAHVLRVTDKVLGGPSVESRTLLTGGKKVAAGIPGVFHETYHFEVDALDPATPKYIVRTSHSGDDFARTSLPLPGKIDWTKKVFYDEIQRILRENLA
jgi:hypothetical protein